MTILHIWQIPRIDCVLEYGQTIKKNGQRKNMPYWRIIYHIVWGTKNRERLISPAIEKDLYGYLRGKAFAMSCSLHAVNSVADHIHLAISIPPALAVARAVGRLKGASAHYLNQKYPMGAYFSWQRSYSVLSISEKDLAFVVGYINRQKQRHAANVLERQLEDLQPLLPGPQGLKP